MQVNLQAASVVSLRKQRRVDLIRGYMRLTEDVLPSLAKNDRRNWPVNEDHCFQRIILDTICDDVWYKHIKRPAYKHLTLDQARRAFELCKAIVDGQEDINKLNQQSLALRGKLKRPC